MIGSIEIKRNKDQEIKNSVSIKSYYYIMLTVVIFSEAVIEGIRYGWQSTS